MSTVISPRQMRDLLDNSGLSVSSAVVSEKGISRQENEDYALADDLAGVFVIADGMGGHEGGAEASQLVCSVIATELMEAKIDDEFSLADANFTFCNAISSALDVMRSVTDACPALHHMGCTLVVGWKVGRTMYYGHVGDSRLYLLRDRKLTKLTQDHSLVEELYKSGAISQEQISRHPWKHCITRHVGPASRDYRIDVGSLALQSGDRLVFLTDGISDVLKDESIGAAAMSARTPEELGQWLARAAQEADARDDRSCVVVDYK